MSDEYVPFNPDRPYGKANNHPFVKYEQSGRFYDHQKRHVNGGSGKVIGPMEAQQPVAEAVAPEPVAPPEPVTNDQTVESTGEGMNLTLVNLEGSHHNQLKAMLASFGLSYTDKAEALDVLNRIRDGQLEEQEAHS